MPKFNWRDLLESMRRELTLDDILEIKKAIIVYDTKIDDNYNVTDEIMDKIIYEGYLYNNLVPIFINEEIVEWIDNYAYLEDKEV